MLGKNVDANGNILEQYKVECPVDDINKAVIFMETINYKKIISIYDKYIFIEIEGNEKLSSIDELKQEINKYDLPINKDNYFVKKVEVVLSKTLKKVVS